MAEETTVKEEKTTTKEVEANNKLLAKKIGILLGRVALTAGISVGVGLIAYKIGAGRGSDAALIEVYKTFPEIRSQLMDMDPALFSQIKL